MTMFVSGEKRFNFNTLLHFLYVFLLIWKKKIISPQLHSPKKNWNHSTQTLECKIINLENFIQKTNMIICVYVCSIPSGAQHSLLVELRGL